MSVFYCNIIPIGAHDLSLFLYKGAFVLDKAAADDIFQETSVILWKEFETFEQGTSFRKWSNTIVFNWILGTLCQNIFSQYLSVPKKYFDTILGNHFWSWYSYRLSIFYV